jgi:malonyl-CoA/methylmalonyl-CoA synthetase
MAKTTTSLVLRRCLTIKTNYKFLNATVESLDENRQFLLENQGKSSFSFKQILQLSQRLSSQLSQTFQGRLNSDKIGIYCSNNHTYLISVLAVWMSNGVPFCLSKRFPSQYIEYFLNDSACKLVINSSNENSTDPSDEDFDAMLNRKGILNFKLNPNELKKALCSTDSVDFEQFIHSLCQNEKNRQGLLLYTSGTSGPSKGVVLTFENLLSSIENMVESYEFRASDFVLNSLPLNHFSGLVYCTLMPFLVGSSLHLLEKFNAKIVWNLLLGSTSSINSYIAVPTIFSQLLSEYSSNSELNERFPREKVSQILNEKMRIIASGTAPLNVKTFNNWYDLTKYRILERYGMTEVGMALTNPYRQTGAVKRTGGTVGRPCGSNRSRICDYATGDVLVESDATNDRVLGSNNKEIFGELQIKGSNVFKEYHNKPEQTKASFTSDGWFKTGDFI